MSQLANELKAELAKVGIDAAVIEQQAEQQCDLCGKIDELRPYGPNGEAICFECGMKDKAGTEKRMNQILFGVTP